MKIQRRVPFNSIQLIGLSLVLFLLIGLTGCNLPGLPQATTEPPALMHSGEQNIPDVEILDLGALAEEVAVKFFKLGKDHD